MSSRAKPTRVKRRRRPQRRRSAARRSAVRATLSREALIKEALVLLDREGPSRFSLRRLADRLGVTPMALYNHVSSKDELLQAIADAVVSGVEYRPVRGHWPRVVAECFRTLRSACLAHPGAVALVESAEVLPAAVFRPMEITLASLERAGFTADDALRAYSVLTTFTLGQVSYQIRGWARGVDPTAAVDDGRISRRRFPAVVDAAAHKSWDFEQAFEFGLSIILAGLNARLRPAPE
jgi:TetR/AcrR family transcriptional regulator, tetracycline repressor protein